MNNWYVDLKRKCEDALNDGHPFCEFSPIDRIPADAVSYNEVIFPSPIGEGDNGYPLFKSCEILAWLNTPYFDGMNEADGADK